MSKKIKNMDDMEKKLAEFNSKTITPTSSIMNPIKKDNETRNEDDEKSDVREKNELKGTKSNKKSPAEPKLNSLSDLAKSTPKLEDTHSRRTFLVENELLERLDEVAEKTKNRSFKTKFINHVIRLGLEEFKDF